MISIFRPFIATFFTIVSFFSCLVHTNCFANDVVKAHIISSVTAIDMESSALMGIEIFIPKGWKIYHPNSDAASPFKRHPQLDTSGSQNIISAKIIWPIGRRVQEEGLEIEVYEDHVILPLIVDIDNTKTPMKLRGKLSLIACNEQCVPYDIPLSFDLPTGKHEKTQYYNNIVAFLENNPAKDFIEIEESPLWLMVLIAFMAGLILNFMPCVLPVMSMKLRSLVAKDHGITYRKKFAFTTCGIMVSFLAYATIASIMQNAGKSLGWGMHFQEPVFIAFMAMLMIFFSANLLGAFDIHLSSSVQNKIHHALDHQKKRVRVYGEEFLSGIFATLLATPCTAPFLGTTLAYALAHDTIYIFILFFMLGFGFAFPYIIGMILPASLMPKPKGGPWLTWVSRILAVGLIMSAMWLIWVFSEINGLYAAFGISLSLLAIMACLFLQRKYRLCKWLLLPLALSVVLVPIFIEERQEIQHATLDEVWHAFEPERIEEIVNSGKIVVVDITASWCVTCKVNKSRVLLDPSISTILSSDKIYCMRADWTNKDNKIAKYLASYKRYGIPFNQVFGPLQKQGIILPEFLDKESILRAIEKVGYEE